MTYDLILRGGRVIDPSQKLDAVTDVAFENGKVARVGPALKGDAGTDVRDMAGAIVTPGLIDLHTHVYWGGTSLGIDAEDFCRQSGVTTAVDTGSAGPGNFAGFRKHVIEPSEVRILAYLHVSFAGIYAFSPRVMVGESEEIRLMAPVDAMEVANANRDIIVGIKVRIGARTSGRSGAAPLDIALQVAEEVGMPVMVHLDDPPPTYEEVIARLRPGDVLTHAFRPYPNTPVTASWRTVRYRSRQRLVRVQDGARDARQRLFSRHDLLRRPCALHQRAGVRPGHYDVEVPVPWDAAHRCHCGLDRQCCIRVEATGAREP
jgi:dihydroorotase